MAIAQSSSPLGVDHFGRPFDWVNDPGRPEDMTSEEFDKWTSMYYDDTPAPSSPGKSPDSPHASAHVNQVNSSPSSEDGHLEFTPSSTALDSLNDVDNVDDADLISTYTTSPSEDFEFISPFSSRSSDCLHVAPPASQVSDAAITSAYRPSASPGDFLPVPTTQQWSSFTTTNSDGSDFALQQDRITQYGFDNNTSMPTSGFHANMPANMTLPLRPMPSSQPLPATHTQSFPTYGTSWGNIHQSFTYHEHQPNTLTTPQIPLYMNQNYVYQPATTQRPTAAISFSGLPASDQHQTAPSQPTAIPIQSRSMNASATRGAERQTPRSQPKLSQSPGKRISYKAEQARASVSRQGPRPIAAAGLPNCVPLRESPDNKQRKGGRRPNSHLTEQARKRSSVMRKKGACWRCRLQRDPCPDDGTPCARCLHVITSQKGQQYFFACDRSKLPDFVHDFLPPSFTTMHSKQNIEDCVQDQVQMWDQARPVEVFLTSGYGPPLRWILHEFQPATMELMAQFQYLQNPHTRQSVRHEKWSPPLGVMRLVPSDDWHFKNYLDELMTDEHLIHFPWRCFEEESQIDNFQAELLALICRLYQATNDIDLQFLLQKLIRMMIITYIMAHTLTITEDSLFGVHAFVRNPNKPSRPQPYTSPRLANRQLKFFFHMLRQNIFDEILKWQQATLCASSGKESTWLSSFVVVLTFAMVLEETQRTMHIQADAKARKRECSFDAAQQEARNACERIDDRFGLLVALFQCKYRDRKWNREGSFGAQTPQLRDADEDLFCKDVRDLLEEKRDLLTDRKAVPFDCRNQCYYTSRLVARFLLPFLDLPA